MTAQTLSARDLMAELRLHLGLDSWGTVMEFWFGVAGEMYERALPIPDVWRYRPSPLGGKDPDAFVTEIFEGATDAALILFGRAINRYAGKLKAAGLDY